MLTEALGLTVRAPVTLTVAGRTDAGVHATGQVAHTDLPSDVDPAWLVRRLARLLPVDVRVRAVTPVPPAFDARFSALRRHYRYRVATAPSGAEPLRARDTLAWPYALDVDAVNAASALLVANTTSRPSASAARARRPCASCSGSPGNRGPTGS